MEPNIASRVAEHVPAMLLYLDRELRVRFANRHCVELLGRAPRELLGRLLGELVDPGTLKYAQGHVAAIESGDPQPRDYVLRDRHGARRFLQVHAVPDRDGEGRSIGYFACTSDKAAERAAQDRLSVALAASGAGLWEWNMKADEAFHSPEFKALLGYTPENFPADFSFFAAVHPEDEEITFDALSVAVQEGGRFDREFRMRRADGEYRWLRARGRATRCPDSGVVTRFTAAARDIGARREAEAELRDARALVDATLEGSMAMTQELEERRRLDRIKRELVTTANHEMRTPLAAIIAALELLREGADARVEQGGESFLGLALRNAEHLARVVEQWLDLERIDLGMIGVNCAPVDLSALVATLLGARATDAAERGVQIERVIGRNVQVNADADRLGQVAGHLVSSALERSPRGTVMRVQVGMREGNAVLMIEDEGPDVFTGLDLGLGACKAIVERLGGTLQVANRAVCGAAFHVELPCS